MDDSRVRVSAYKLFQLAEQFVPALLVAVARGSIEELLMVQRQQRAGAIWLQRDREQRFALRRRMPGPAEHQPFVRYDLAIDTADLEIFAVFAGEVDAVTPADAQIGLGLQGALLHLRGPEP